MKQASKVFIILGMVIGCILIVPIIVGAIALGKLEKAKTKDDLTTVAIITLLFCNLLGGIFMLMIENEELKGNKSLPWVETEEALDIENAFERLRRLKLLFDCGAITQEEFESKRVKYLSEI